MLMRAAIQTQYGAPDVLRQALVERAIAAEDELLIRVQAASVNGYDVLLRSGALKMVVKRGFPKRSGLDFVGSVAEASSNSSFKVGDEIWGVMPLHRVGSVADYLAIGADHVSLRPANISAESAAALPVVGATALAALRDVAGLRAGARLLIRGAAGGVGSSAVQIGKAMGAHVTGLASRRDLGFVRDLGADDAFDYAAVSPDDLGCYDAILDTVGTGTASYRRILAKGGRLVAIVPDPKKPLLWMAYAAFSRVFGTARVRYFNSAPDSALLGALTTYVEAGALKPIVASVYRLADIAQAHQAFETRTGRGKYVIRTS